MHGAGPHSAIVASRAFRLGVATRAGLAVVLGDARVAAHELRVVCQWIRKRGRSPAPLGLQGTFADMRGGAGGDACGDHRREQRQHARWAVPEWTRR